MKILNTEAVKFLDELNNQNFDKGFDFIDPIFKVKLKYVVNPLMADYYEPLESKN